MWPVIVAIVKAASLSIEHNIKTVISQSKGKAIRMAMAIMPLARVKPAVETQAVLVLVISTSCYDSITYYDGLPYLLPTCFSFIAAL